MCLLIEYCSCQLLVDNTNTGGVFGLVHVLQSGLDAWRQVAADAGARCDGTGARWCR